MANQFISYGGGGGSGSGAVVAWKHEQIGIGDGVTTVFNISVAPTDLNSFFLFISTVPVQNIDYTLVGIVVTFVAAPPPGRRIIAKFQ